MVIKTLTMLVISILWDSVRNPVVVILVADMIVVAVNKSRAEVDE